MAATKAADTNGGSPVATRAIASQHIYVLDISIREGHRLDIIDAAETTSVPECVLAARRVGNAQLIEEADLLRMLARDDATRCLKCWPVVQAAPVTEPKQ